MLMSLRAEGSESITLIQETYLASDAARSKRLFHTASADILCTRPVTRHRQQKPGADVEGEASQMQAR